MPMTRDAAIWLHSLAPDAPEKVQGLLIIAGITVPIIAACGLAALGAWLWRQRDIRAVHQPLRHRNQGAAPSGGRRAVSRLEVTAAPRQAHAA